MRITWMGHSCFEVYLSGQSFLIDPFLGASEVTPHELSPDVVLVSHGHGDHLGLAPEFDAPVACTPEVADYLSSSCETVDFNIGGTVSFGGVDIHMTVAFHSSSLNGHESYGGMPAGFVLEDDESVYHAGDTSLFVDMRETIGRVLEPDVALLPIGDHYTMGPESAAMASDWLGVEVAIPMHFDTFPAVEQSPERFVSLLPDGVEGVVLGPGESYTYGG